MLHVTNLHRADRILERGLGQPNVAADLHANLNRIFFLHSYRCTRLQKRAEMIISPWHKRWRRQAVTLYRKRQTKFNTKCWRALADFLSTKAITQIPCFADRQCHSVRKSRWIRHRQNAAHNIKGGTYLSPVRTLHGNTNLRKIITLSVALYFSETPPFNTESEI